MLSWNHLEQRLEDGVREYLNEIHDKHNQLDILVAIQSIPDEIHRRHKEQKKIQNGKHTATGEGDGEGEHTRRGRARAYERTREGNK